MSKEWMNWLPNPQLGPEETDPQSGEVTGSGPWIKNLGPHSLTQRLPVSFPVLSLYHLDPLSRKPWLQLSAPQGGPQVMKATSPRSIHGWASPHLMTHQGRDINPHGFHLTGVTLMGSPSSRADLWDHPASVGPSSQINWPFPRSHFLLLPCTGTNSLINMLYPKLHLKFWFQRTSLLTRTILQGPNKMPQWSQGP